MTDLMSGLHFTEGIEPCAKEIATESCNDDEVGCCVAAVVGEGANHAELDMECFTDKRMVEILTPTELHPSLESHAKDVVMVTEQELSPEVQLNDVRGDCVGSQPQPHAQAVINTAEQEPSAESLKTEAFETDIVKNVSEMVMETCTGNDPSEPCDGNLVIYHSSSNAINEFGTEPCPAGDVKESSNGDVCSEVLNPNKSPNHVLDKVNVRCGEVTSPCCGTSFSEGSSGKEEHGDVKLESVPTSCVVLEIPKHIRPTGIRKLTFKFRKRKEDFDSDVSAALKTLYKNGFEKGSLAHKNAKMDLNMACIPNRELMMSKKIIPDNYPAKKLLHVPSLNQQSNVEVSAELKRPIKKLRHSVSSSLWDQKKTSEGGTKKRDNDLHKLLFMPNGLPDGTSLAYYSKGKRILGGYKQGNGIVCSCCNTEISPSQFEAHAGWAVKRQPYRHIHTSSGLTLHDVALMLAKGRNLTSCGNDDVCSICGDEGDLKTCNGCSRAFHAACVDPLCLPTDDLHCPSCGDKISPCRRASGESRPIILRLRRVVKAPEFESGGCVICRSQDFSAVKFDDRTVIICDQCEKEYHVGCLRETGMSDLKELPEDKWFCCDSCYKISETLQNMACSVPESIPAAVSAALYKKQTMIAPEHFPDGLKNEIRWCILSGKECAPEHSFLLSRAAAIFRECFDPIVAKSGRDLIPIMVHGKNISGQDFSGMYCAVLIVKSVVVSAALLRIFGQEVAELPLVATNRENQGKPRKPNPCGQISSASGRQATSKCSSIDTSR
ncbi:uncharacterized protein LOC127239631 isoform X2 [Andrographis paniculata]|uniref:uncharacterized protein LOC127239631 isoform X2 n=1 Tax=Andrographis paniculata TaxID=175694 RepID=UPI0021E7412F|nr:uncharacterized protein LOC127239631 isoform X2 [Andrographis paniculata]